MKNPLRLRAAPVVLFTFVIVTAQCTPPQSSNRPSVQASPTPSPVSSPAAASLPPLQDGVVLKATVREDTGRRPTVVGETNLPDGTEGIASIQSKTTKKEGSDKFTVQGGRFEAGPFSDGGQGLTPGNYTLDVTIAQPPPVKAVIGQNGENLRGPLVDHDEIGTSVRLSQDFRLDAQGKFTAGADADAGAVKSLCRRP